MKKTDLIIGFFLGILATSIGAFLFIKTQTNLDFMTGIKTIEKQGNLGKLIAIGAVFNLVLFFLLLKFQKELIARGVVLSTIFLALVTLFL